MRAMYTNPKGVKLSAEEDSIKKTNEATQTFKK
jgi:hypothetical protein